MTETCIFTNDGFNWILEINGILIKDHFKSVIEAYEFYKHCTKCWFEGFDN
jgi:hypothetical protein